jgi:hypothetical protein
MAFHKDVVHVSRKYIKFNLAEGPWITELPQLVKKWSASKCTTIPKTVPQDIPELAESDFKETEEKQTYDGAVRCHCWG